MLVSNSFGSKYVNNWEYKLFRLNLYHSCKSDVVENLTHLIFGWPVSNISLTIHPTHSKLYIFVILIASRIIWYTWKVFWPPPDFCVTPTEKGPNRPKFCQNNFWPLTTLKPPITHFRQNGTWVLLPQHVQSSITMIYIIQYIYLYHFN